MKKWYLILAIALAVVWVFSVESRLFKERSLAEWNAWVNTVQIACQGSSNQKDIIRTLGKPALIEESTRLSYRKAIRFVNTPKNISSAYFYHYYSWPYSTWATYIFFDSSGKVVDYRIFQPSDSL